MTAKSLMMTRCNLKQFNIVRLSNIVLRYSLLSAHTQRRVTGISVITQTTCIVYTNLFLTNDSRSRKLVFNNFKCYSGKIIKIILFGADKSFVKNYNTIMRVLHYCVHYYGDVCPGGFCPGGECP